MKKCTKDEKLIQKQITSLVSEIHVAGLLAELKLRQTWFRIQLLISCTVDFKTYQIKDLESKHIDFELKSNVSAI